MNDKHIKKVISGSVTKKKPSIGKKLFDAFISNDIDDIGDYILNDIIVPNIKYAISDGVDSLLGVKKSKSSKSGTYTSYGGYYNKKDSSRERIKKERGSTRYKYDEIIIDTRAEATEVLEYLRSILREYDVVSVADFYETVGAPSNYTDNKYGWTNLDDVKIQRDRNGYIIDFPRVEEID